MKNQKIVAAMVQTSLPMRGYTLCDSDWRYPALRNLATLGKAEEEVLTKMEEGEEIGISDADYDKLEAQLNRVTANTMDLWIGVIRPCLQEWWVKEV